VSNATDKTPSGALAQGPVKFTEAAEFLLFAAAIYLDDHLDDPLKILRTLPRECMDVLSYTFVIACSDDTLRDLREKTRAHYSVCEAHKGFCILGTGPLSVWYDALVINLTHQETPLWGDKETRILFDKMLLLLEKEGLRNLFDGGRKKALPDKTFLLEHK
jgi:hypothetical protein